MPPLALTSTRRADGGGHELDGLHRGPARGMESGGGLDEFGPRLDGRPAHVDQRLPAGQVSNTADSTITFMTMSGTAARTAAISARTASMSPETAAPMSITMSISSAPSATASSASRALIDERCLPDGNPTTVAIGRAAQASRFASRHTMDGEMHTENTSARGLRAWDATSAVVASGLSSVWSTSAATCARSYRP